MASLIDRSGIFRATIQEYGLKEAKEGSSLAVTIRVILDEIYHQENKQWEEWPYGQEAYGDSWIVKKDGTLNEFAVKALAAHAGWDGTIDSIVNKTWNCEPIQVEIQADTYNGTTRYKIAFINAWNSDPSQRGGVGNVDANKARILANKYNSSLKAFAANAKQVHGTPPPPPPPPPQPTARPAPPANYDDGNIPF